MGTGSNNAVSIAHISRSGPVLDLIPSPEKSAIVAAVQPTELRLRVSSRRRGESETAKTSTTEIQCDANAPPFLE